MRSNLGRRLAEAVGAQVLGYTVLNLRNANKAQTAPLGEALQTLASLERSEPFRKASDPSAAGLRRTACLIELYRARVRELLGPAALDRSALDAFCLGELLAEARQRGRWFIRSEAGSYSAVHEGAQRPGECRFAGPFAREEAVRLAAAWNAQAKRIRSYR